MYLVPLTASVRRPSGVPREVTGLRAGPLPRLRRRDRLFWVLARCLCADWCRHLVLVRPETVLRWHRQVWPPVLADPRPAGPGRRREPRRDAGRRNRFAGVTLA